jgi:hypothetical protein
VYYVPAAPAKPSQGDHPREDASSLRPEVIERQLAHVKKDKVESRYNRAQYRSEREPTDAALGR